jgi:hypothetical protein
MSTSISGYCACDPASACGGTYAAASAFRAEAAFSKSSDIVIETLEGDRVTLSSSAYAAGEYCAYEAFAMGNGAAAWQSGTSAGYEAGRAFSLSVSGDLNARELGDINKILKTLDKMMGDLAAGDLEGALAGSAKFAGIESIASFSADMRITASVAVSRYETAAASMPMPGAEGGNGCASGRIDRAADRFARCLNTGAVPGRNLEQTLEKFFSDWFDERSSENEDVGTGMKWASRFARRLLDGLGAGGDEETKSRRYEERKDREGAGRGGPMSEVQKS